MSGATFNMHNLSPYLGTFGLLGTFILLLITGAVLWQYRTSSVNGFQRRMRNLRLKQICAIACLFFLAMSASYWVIQDPLGWVYLLVAAKCGTWWFRRAFPRGI